MLRYVFLPPAPESVNNRNLDLTSRAKLLQNPCRFSQTPQNDERVRDWFRSFGNRMWLGVPRTGIASGCLGLEQGAGDRGEHTEHMDRQSYVSVKHTIGG